LSEYVNLQLSIVLNNEGNVNHIPSLGSYIYPSGIWCFNFCFLYFKSCFRL